MRDSRIGESLWLEWVGDGLPIDAVIYYTETHVDMDNDVVRRALASSLQRDGIAISLGEGYRLAEQAELTYTYAGYLDGSLDLIVCDADGMTEDGDVIDDVLDVTLAELQWLQ